MIAVSKKTRTITRFSYNAATFGCARKTPPSCLPGRRFGFYNYFLGIGAQNQIAQPIDVVRG
jgi:hypothetical protein